MIPIGLEIFRFSRAIFNLPEKSPIPENYVNDPYLGFIFDAPLGYYMYTRLVFEDFMYDCCKKQLQAALEPRVKIQMKKGQIFFPTIKDVFHGLLTIFEVLYANKHYSHLYEDRVHVFSNIVRRLDEITKLFELNTKMSKLSISKVIRRRTCK